MQGIELSVSFFSPYLPPRACLSSSMSKVLFNRSQDHQNIGMFHRSLDGLEEHVFWFRGTRTFCGYENPQVFITYRSDLKKILFHYQNLTNAFRLNIPQRQKMPIVPKDQ
jgi:hypothetical protein